MTAIWVQRREAQRPANLAAQIEWLRHRHHCWDPEGGPLVGDTTTDVTAYVESLLTQVNALWARAAEHDKMSEALKDEARNERLLAEDLYEQAERIWSPIAEDNPEWRDAFIMGVDPRTVVTSDGEDEA